MIFVYLNNLTSSFESDIRDLCMAFYPYQKVCALDQSQSESEIIERKRTFVEKQRIIEKKDKSYEYEMIDIKDFYDGTMYDSRNDQKSEIKRQLYNYLSLKTSKKLVWGTLTGIRPTTIVTHLYENCIESEIIDKTSSIKTKAITNSECEKNNCKETSDQQKPVEKISIENKICDAGSNLNIVSKLNINANSKIDLIRKYLSKEFFLSDEKTNELIDIGIRETTILSRDKIKDYKNTHSIYIGIPFCKSTCLYCSFASHNINKFKNEVNDYIDALEIELKNRVKATKPLTIYIGGGTPTSLSEELFERLLCLVDTYVDRSNCIEYTVEAGRADTISTQKLKSMMRHKVSRISINPQTFSDDTLKLIGRNHTVEEFLQVYNTARDMGFDNINTDIILGLPDEHIDHIKYNIEMLKKLNPESFTVHSLALKRAARLNLEIDDWTNNHFLAGLDDVNEMHDMMDLCTEYAESANLYPYYMYRQKNIAGGLENIGFAKEGYECIYNIMMMSERHTVYGYGTSSTKEISYNGTEKIVKGETGYKSVKDYIANIMNLYN